MRRAVAAVLLLAACDTLPRSAVEQAAIDEAARAPEPDVRGLDAWLPLFPELRADVIDRTQTLTARDVRVVELVGGRPAIVALWATYCAPCLDELPILDGLARDGAAVLALSFDGDQAARVIELRRAHGALHPAAILTPPSLSRAADALPEGLPLTIVVDAAGVPRELLRGRLTRGRLD
ncbi:TlpA family protein disulfide reductase, partial [Myxococcota bacterium]|nr:TlpA family protein disulfide reductase [Myxococcota bacterium]